MGWRVRTVVVAEFAVIAFLFNLFVVGGGHFGNIAFVLINSIQQGIKGRAEIKTPTASIADVENSIGLLFEIRTSPIRRNEINALQCLSCLK